jgi:2-polyprenyl-3-methyl-5-hydroxy-6-metoxy-1,4-benzoquinol methylase
MTPEDCSVNNDAAPHLGLSDRLSLLEDSIHDVEKLIGRIQSLMGYRLLRRIKIYYLMLNIKMNEAYDNFLRSKFYESLGHFWGRLTKKYYSEDYIRVYPDSILFDHRGRPLEAGDDAIKNYLNHVKFYKFVAQFVKDKKVVDVGCGSGYGCELLKNSGAADVYGADISKHAIQFADSKFGGHSKFSVQSITDLKEYPDEYFDVTLSSEVLEHIKEYGVEQKAIEELKRITKNNGLVIIATPNNEMLDDHGFSYDELYQLFNKNFSKFCIFENAFIPSGSARALWQRRLQEERVGVIISEQINLSETFLPGGIVPELKKGIEAGTYMFDTYEIDTKLLHNTHSWVVLAVNDN